MSEQYLPAARTSGLVVRELAEETLVYDEERHRAHCLNRTAALVWRHCDGKTPVSVFYDEFRSDVPDGARPTGRIRPPRPE